MQSTFFIENAAHRYINKKVWDPRVWKHFVGYIGYGLGYVPVGNFYPPICIHSPPFSQQPNSRTMAVGRVRCDRLCDHVTDVMGKHKQPRGLTRVHGSNQRFTQAARRSRDCFLGNLVTYGMFGATTG